MPSVSQPESSALPSPRGPGDRLRGAALDLADDAVRQGLKHPLIGPGRAVRRMFGADRLRDAVGGRTVVITGASSGIGEATANRFAHAGARVVLVARREEELARVVGGITETGGEATAYPCDLSDREAIEALTAKVLAEQGTVDILVNNAGRSIRRSIVDSLDRFHDFERTMALNYYGPVALSLGLLPAMIAQDRGQIINISTWATQLPSPQYVAYTASKAALDAFTRGTAAEMLGTGIALSSVHLPLVRTPMITPALEAYRGMPSLSAHEAAGLIAEAAVLRSSRVEPAIVTLGHIGDAFSSRGTDLVMGAMQKVGLGPVGRRH
ncbi:MAG: SDR family NAD(P)-dependent oxidoreductase [Solirubrobacteraceae bacterium]|nr:SDR family NAD(P)-dependent oxidoreductase [Solirubrobacteraceae bacterium]